MKLRCVPGEELMAMATLFAIEFSRGQDGNEILAWGDFFGIVASGLIAIADRTLYITDPTSDCCKKKPKPAPNTVKNEPPNTILE